MIPSEWKSAKVTPIYKSGNKSDPNNYRPISVLPLISKVMEEGDIGGLSTPQHRNTAEKIQRTLHHRKKS